MAMRDIDRGQVFMPRRNPICECSILVDSQQGIDEDRVGYAVDQSRGAADPIQLFLAGWKIACEAPAFRHEHIPIQRNLFARHFTCSPSATLRLLFFIATMRSYLSEASIDEQFRPGDVAAVV